MLSKIGTFMLGSWELMLLLATWLGIALVAIRARKDWQRRRFTSQVNFSLSLLQDDEQGRPTLHLRTLLEDGASHVWLNDYGVKLVLQAARNTTQQQPILRVHPPEDQGFVKQAVLNVLSEKFSHTYVAEALGLPVRSATFVFAIAWERYEDMRSQKLRVLIASPEVLERVFAAPDEIEVTAEPHRHRLTTLREMQRLRLSSDAADRALLGEVVLGVLGTGQRP